MEKQSGGSRLTIETGPLFRIGPRSVGPKCEVTRSGNAAMAMVPSGNW